MDDLRDPKTRIAEVLTDYRNGHLDSLEDAVEAIVEAVGREEVLRLIPIKPLELGDAAS